MQTAGEDSKKTKPAARKKSKEIKVVDKIYRLYYKQTYEYEKLLLIKVNHKHIQTYRSITQIQSMRETKTTFN